MIICGQQYVVVNFLSNRLSSEYVELEYIQSDGKQYIEPEYQPTPNTGIYSDFQFTNIATQYRLFGSGSDNSVEGKLNFEFYINGSRRWAYAYNNKKGNWVNTKIAADTNRHTLSFNVVNKKILIDNGSTYNSTLKGTATINSSYPFLILGRQYETNAPAIGWNPKIILYSFKIYEASFTEASC